MFKSIKVNRNDRENLLLFDTHEVVINRGSGDSAELVIYPSVTGRLSVRFAKEPYGCRIWFANNEYKDIHLGDDEDWATIDTTYPLHPRFRNGFDRNGFEKYREIVKVEVDVGGTNGVPIPLEEFSRDVDDFIIYYEA